MQDINVEHAFVNEQPAFCFNQLLNSLHKSTLNNESILNNNKKTRGRPKKVVYSSGVIVHKQSNTPKYVLIAKDEKIKMIKEFKTLMLHSSFNLKDGLKNISDKYKLPYTQVYEYLANLY